MQGYGLASRVLSHEASSLAFCYFLNLPWRPMMVKFFHPTMSACNLTLIGQLKEQKPRACKQILENYACTLGRKVNFNKTLVYINSDVTTVHTYIMLQRTMGLNIHGKKKIQHLGAPITATHPRKEAFQQRIAKMYSLTPGWQSKHLSMAGRLILIKLVTSSLPTFLFQPVRYQVLPSTYLKDR